MKNKYISVLIVPIFLIAFLLLKMSFYTNAQFVNDDYDEEYKLVAYSTVDVQSLYLNEKYLRIAKLADPKADSKNIVDRPTTKPLNNVLAALALIDERDQPSAILFMNTYFQEPGVDILKQAGKKEILFIILIYHSRQQNNNNNNNQDLVNNFR